MSISTPQARAERFVAGLRRVREDRGKMAALRRSLSSRNQMDAWPVIADLGGDIERPLYAAIAALYATHPEEIDTANFGATCRQIALKDSSDGKLPESYERRFRRLIACDTAQQLGDHLRAWIRLASSKGAGVNYERLFTDLWNWDRYANDIRVRWASEFWPARRVEEPAAKEEDRA
ncbi:MAG: type I-E CRISPR-associated protein Cse2/CasB [Verrucomicrobiales bacterium]|nr:type I-E CRISPR-associated protein Cse2/CasB [Verrucomicrobiales bacterium]